MSSAPESTKRNKMLAVKTFENCQEKYDNSSANIIDEIHQIKKENSEEYESALYDVLQEWINWNNTMVWILIGLVAVVARFGMAKWWQQRQMKNEIEEPSANQ